MADLLSWQWAGIEGPVWAAAATSFILCAALTFSLPSTLSWDTRSRVTSTVHAAVSVLVSIVIWMDAAPHLFKNDMYMWFNDAMPARVGLGITYGYILFDWLLGTTYGLLDIPMHIHHGVVLLGYAIGLSTRFATPYQAVFLINEASTPFVNIHFAARPTGLGKVLNGAAMWLTYLFFRMTANAILLASIAYTVDDRVWAREGLQLMVQVSMCVAVQFLNVMWFYKITMGLIKAIRTGGKTSKPAGSNGKGKQTAGRTTRADSKHSIDMGAADGAPAPLQPVGGVTSGTDAITDEKGTHAATSDDGLRKRKARQHA